MIPTIRLLIFSADPTYFGLARLPQALKNAGFEVAALCLPEALLAKTRYLDRLFPLAKTMDSAKLLKQLAEAMEDWQPDLLICGDEMTVALSHYVARNTAKLSKVLSTRTLQLLKASVGDPQFFDATLFKHDTLAAANALGLRVPAMTSVTNVMEAWHFVEKIGYPVVLKKNFGCAGVGVKVCRNEAAVASALQTFMPRSQSHFKVFAQKQLRRDWFPTGKVLSLQQFIQGRTAMYPLVALNGEILAGFAAIKEVTCSETGPSSLIRLINHDEMQATATALIQQFQFTGFASFDFMIEAETGHAYLLECNPRPVPVCHLGTLGGVNLGQALFARLSGQPWKPQTSVEQEQVICLFPQEWRRDPNSANLHQIYHDVPWDDPALVKAYVESA